MLPRCGRLIGLAPLGPQAVIEWQSYNGASATGILRNTSGHPLGVRRVEYAPLAVATRRGFAAGITTSKPSGAGWAFGTQVGSEMQPGETREFTFFGSVGAVPSSMPSRVKVIGFDGTEIPYQEVLP